MTTRREAHYIMVRYLYVVKWKEAKKHAGNGQHSR